MWQQEAPRLEDILVRKMMHQMRLFFKKICIFVVFCCCFSESFAIAPDSTLAASNTAPANPTPSAKDEDLAHTVLGIMSYTRWVPPPTPVNVCIVAPTQHTPALEHLLTEGNPSNKIVVSKQSFDVPTLSTQCDVIYFGEISPIDQQKVITARQNHPILLISENNPDCELGSSFCLNIETTPITFLVNLDSLARSGVHVDPNVLLLGRKKKVAP